ncbi:MAG TPA: hypothetical protein V6C57_06855 [Coleofasciculaceae cyanobacterium]
MQQRLFLLIKCLSILLITGAIGLNLWQLQSGVTQSRTLAVPPFVVWVSQFALAAHGLEGVIAAVYASRQQKSPFFYAIYTFFVGTVGLVELFACDAEKVE